MFIIQKTKIKEKTIEFPEVEGKEKAIEFPEGKGKEKEFPEGECEEKAMEFPEGECEEKAMEFPEGKGKEIAVEFPEGEGEEIAMEFPEGEGEEKAVEFPKGKGEEITIEFAEEKSDDVVSEIMPNGVEIPFSNFFARNSLYNEILEQSSRRQSKLIANAVTLLTLRLYGMLGWQSIAELFSYKLFRSIRRSLFKSLAKFILCIFDMEDFERISCGDQIQDQRYKLWTDSIGGLSLEDDSDGFRIQDKLWADPSILSLESLVKVLEVRENVDDFSMLREKDVGSIVKVFKDGIERITKIYKADVMRSVITPPIRTEGVFRKSNLKMVMEVMRKHVPLKKENKLHLLNELARGETSCFFTAFIMEFWKQTNLIELEEHVIKKTKNLEKIIYKEGKIRKIWFEDDYPVEWLWTLVEQVLSLMQMLGDFKITELQHSQALAAYPLRCGDLGEFEDEVIEVVKQADLERKVQGHHFIGVHHLLSCLLQTRIVENMKNFRILQWSSASNEPSAFPIYHIYRSSQDFAKFLGDKIVGIEHLFLAIVFERNSIRKSDWESFGRKKEVHDFIEDVRKNRSNVTNGKTHSEAPDLLSRICPEGMGYTGTYWSLVKQLYKAFESGFDPLEEAVRMHNRGRF